MSDEDGPITHWASGIYPGNIFARGLAQAIDGQYDLGSGDIGSPGIWPPGTQTHQKIEFVLEQHRKTGHRRGRRYGRHLRYLELQKEDRDE